MAGSWRLRGHCAGCCDCRDWHFGVAAGWPKPASGDCAGYPPDRQPEGTSPLRRRGNVLAAIQQPSYMPAKAGKRVFTPPAGTPKAAGVVQAEWRSGHSGKPHTGCSRAPQESANGKASQVQELETPPV